MLSWPHFRLAGPPCSGVKTSLKTLMFECLRKMSTLNLLKADSVNTQANGLQIQLINKSKTHKKQQHVGLMQQITNSRALRLIRTYNSSNRAMYVRVRVLTGLKV